MGDGHLHKIEYVYSFMTPIVEIKEYIFTDTLNVYVYLSSEIENEFPKIFSVFEYHDNKLYFDEHNYATIVNLIEIMNGRICNFSHEELFDAYFLAKSLDVDFVKYSTIVTGIYSSVRRIKINLTRGERYSISNVELLFYDYNILNTNVLIKNLSNPQLHKLIKRNSITRDVANRIAIELVMRIRDLEKENKILKDLL